MNQVRWTADLGVGLAGVLMLMGFATAGLQNPELAAAFGSRVVLVLVLLTTYALGRVFIRKARITRFGIDRDMFNSALIATCLVGLTLAVLIR